MFCCLVVAVLQHEYDHLDGTVYIDHLSPPEREKVSEESMKCLRDEHVSLYQLFSDLAEAAAQNAQSSRGHENIFLSRRNDESGAIGCTTTACRFVSFSFLVR